MCWNLSLRKASFSFAWLLEVISPWLTMKDNLQCFTSIDEDYRRKTGKPSLVLQPKCYLLFFLIPTPLLEEIRINRRESITSTGSMKKSVTFISKPEIVLFVPAHKCEDCGLEFETIFGLEDHAERSHRREWVRCLICVKTVKHAEHFVIWNSYATAENILRMLSRLGLCL